VTGTGDPGPARSGRGWAYVGVVLGGTVSVAANVAASFIPPQGAPPGWVPEPGAVVSAVFWPLLLMVAVELFARIGWPPGWRWWLLRVVGLVPVASIAAVVSYRHLSALLRFYGEDPLTATLGPLAVDGLMVMAAGALLSGRNHRHEQQALATIAAQGSASRLDTAPGLPHTNQATYARRGEGSAQRSDADLIVLVKRLPRNPDGTVPVRRAAKALGTGPNRAKRLLRAAGLLRPVVPVPDPPVAASIDTQDSDVR